MKYCRKCGTQLSDDAQFCPKCGTQQAEETNKITSDTTTEQEVLQKPKGSTLVGIWVAGILASIGAAFLLDSFFDLSESGFPWGLIILLVGLVITGFLSKVEHSKLSEVWGWIISYSILGILGIFCGILNEYSEEDFSKKETVKTEKLVQDIPSNLETVTVSKMIKDLLENEMRAQRKYHGNWFEIVGTLGAMDSEGEYFVLNDVNLGGLIYVTCYLSKKRKEELMDKVAQLEKGDKIAVKGKIKDMGEWMGYDVTIVDVYKK